MIIPILIIGAQKSGSSYLFYLLAQAPSVAVASVKEPMIFSKPMHDKDTFVSHFRITPEHRYALDGSVSYMHVDGTVDQVAKRIGTEIPVIVVLRDPAERAISGYLHEVKHGRELRGPEEVFKLPSEELVDTLEAEHGSIEDAWQRGDIQPHRLPNHRYRDPMFQFRYIANSYYSNQLRPWLQRFPNLRFVDFSNLCESPEQVTTRLRQWLGLDSSHPIETSQPSNPTRLRPWQAFKENRSLVYDHRRPSIISVWTRQRVLMQRLRAEKPMVPVSLASLLRADLDQFRDQEAARWI